MITLATAVMEEDARAQEGQGLGHVQMARVSQSSGLLTSRQVCFLSHTLKKGEGKTPQLWPKGLAGNAENPDWAGS